MAEVSTITFDDVSETLIEQAEEYLATFLAEQYPSLDLTPGRVTREIVLNVAAILHAQNREDIDILRKSFSPVTIAEDPAAADDDIVDAVYGNYRIERYEGNKATGLIAVIISSNITTLVPDDAVFTTNGLNYVVTQPYIGVTTADAVVSSSERLIEERPDGSFVFTVPVVAEDVGEAYRAERSARFTASPAIIGTIDLQAAADFEGGIDAETNAELTERVQQGIAPTVFSGRAQVAALIQDQYPGVVDISQVGFGDAEMLRDRYNIFRTSQGGKSDLYVQTAAVPTEIKLTKECTYVGDNIWQFSLLRDDAPGFYLVTAVIYKGQTAFTGSLEVTSEVRGYDTTLETDWVQDINSAQEGMYTRYQTAVVKFRDPLTAVTTLVGDKVEYDVYALRMPSIQGINDLTVERQRRPQCGDYLPKAPVPAFAAVSLRVYQRQNTATPDTAAMKTAIASKINSLGFSIGRLPMALITDAAQGALESGGTHMISPLDMYAFIYPPDTAPNGRILLRDVHELLIPDLPARGVSQRTTVFYLPESAINITVMPMPGKAI